MLVFYCYVMYYQFRGMKPNIYYLIFPKARSLGRLSWFLCSGSHEAEIKMAVKLGLI